MAFGNGPFVFRINDGTGGPSLLLQVCVERGWHEYTECGLLREKWNLWWRTSGFPVNHHKFLKTWQFTNHIPKGSTICRKDNLARYLKCMRKVHGAIYDFIPAGYNLPLEYTKLVTECSRLMQNHEPRVWICKPVSQSQGRGIFLFRKLSELYYDSNAVVQHYIENPLLIGGYKFDLRLYVCVPSYRPLAVYLYREGLTRFGTEKFSLTDLDNPFCHLTNSSLNKLGPGYAEKKDRVGAGCKWSLKQLRHYFTQAGIADWLLWQRVASLVILTVLSQINGVPPSANCFEFYGFDILVDSALKPWLLEVNLSPALSNDCDVDVAVKKPMLHDLFDLMGLPVCNTGLSLFTIWSPGDRKTDSEDNDEPESCAGSSPVSRWRRYNQMPAKPRPRKKSAPPPATAKMPGKSASSLPTTCSKSRRRPMRPTSVILGEEDPLAGKASNNNLEDAYSPHLGGKFPPQTGWGNGCNWRTPPETEGGWVRLYPFTNVTSSLVNSISESASNLPWEKEAKVVVAAVSKFTRVARELARRHPKQSDDAYNIVMEQTLGLTTKVWLPKK